MNCRVTLITGNKYKAEEFISILGDTYRECVVIERLHVPELQGDIIDICYNKCQAAMKLIAGPVIIEDSSLCCSALKGLPGPYIKSFVRKIGPQGIHKILTAYADKTAQAVCTLAFTEGFGKEIQLFQGRIDGIIVEPRGSSDFGWDSCFQPLCTASTFAEMQQEEKNKISHRFMAIKAFKNHLIM